MADDIVTRLRDCSPPNPLGCVWCEAADEIVRLRAEVEQLTNGNNITAHLPDFVAIDGRGYWWRGWHNEPAFWSMVPNNPDNFPIPHPVKFYTLVETQPPANWGADSE